MLFISLGFLAGQKMPTMHNMITTSWNKFARCWAWVEGHWAVGYTLIQQLSLSTLMCTWYFLGKYWVCFQTFYIIWIYGLFAARVQRSTWLTLLADYHVQFVKYVACRGWHSMWTLFHPGTIL
jgi:hypothetical protein